MSDYDDRSELMYQRDSPFNHPKPIVQLPEELSTGIIEAAKPYPIPEGRKYEYGTAGVRAPEHSIDAVMLTSCSFE